MPKKEQRESNYKLDHLIALMEKISIPIAPIPAIPAIAPIPAIPQIISSGDHDLLISFRAETVAGLDNVRKDITKLSDGTSAQIADHETRLNSLENSKTKQTTMLTIGIGILSILVSIIVYHIMGK